jgi:tight adherence protein B
VNFVLALGMALGALLIFEGASARTRPVRPSRTSSRVVTPTHLAWSLSSGLLGALAVAAVTASAVTGMAVGLVLGWVPIARATALERARIREARAEWPDAIATLVASLRAGRSLPEACEDLSANGGRALKPGFEAFARSYRAMGSFSAGIGALRDRLADPIADRVAVALLMAHEVGGTDLIRVLRTLGDFVRDDLRVRREVEARWSWTVTAARLAAAAPWIVLVLMGMQPEAGRAYSSPTGAVIIAVGLVATLVGYQLMLRAARLPEDRRLV